MFARFGSSLVTTSSASTNFPYHTTSETCRAIPRLRRGAAPTARFGSSLVTTSSASTNFPYPPRARLVERFRVSAAAARRPTKRASPKIQRCSFEKLVFVYFNFAVKRCCWCFFKMLALKCRENAVVWMSLLFICIFTTLIVA